MARNQGGTGLTGEEHRSDWCVQRVDLGDVISPSSELRFGRSTYGF
jgi:hypothetical protein